MESGLKKIRFRRPDSLVSCGRKADSSKKDAVSNLPGLVWTAPNASSVSLSKMHRGFEKVLESGSKEKRIHIVCKLYILYVRSKTHQNENNDPADKIAGKRENNKKNANKSVIVKALAGETF